MAIIKELSTFWTKEKVRSVAMDKIGLHEEIRGLPMDTIDHYINDALSEVFAVAEGLNSVFYDTVGIALAYTAAAITPLPLYDSTPANALAYDGASIVPVGKILALTFQNTTGFIIKVGTGMSADAFDRNVTIVAGPKYQPLSSLYVNDFIYKVVGTAIYVAPGSGMSLTNGTLYLTFKRTVTYPIVGSTGDATKIDLPNEFIPLLLMKVADRIRKRIDKPPSEIEVTENKLMMDSLLSKYQTDVRQMIPQTPAVEQVKR